jgi:hypothetical protein
MLLKTQFGYTVWFQVFIPRELKLKILTALHCNLLALAVENAFVKKKNPVWFEADYKSDQLSN